MHNLTIPALAITLFLAPTGCGSSDPSPTGETTDGSPLDLGPGDGHVDASPPITSDSAPESNCEQLGPECHTHEAHLLAPPNAGSPDGAFGYSMAATDDIIAVGDLSGLHPTQPDVGVVHIYTRNEEGVWALVQTLSAKDDDGMSAFGSAVALSGNTLVVGALGHPTIMAESVGAMYVFTREGDRWVQQQRLFRDDAGAKGTVGASVAIDGDTIVAGLQEEGPGGAYVFVREDGRWHQQAKLVGSHLAPGAYLGSSVAIHGDLVVVGAPEESSDSVREHGSAFIFTRHGDTWSESAKLMAQEPQDSGSVGVAVALADDHTVLLGATNTALNSIENSGGVLVFQKTKGGWIQTQVLAAPDLSPAAYLGTSLAASPTRLLAGANGDTPGDVPEAGSAYLFERAADTERWQLVRKLFKARPAGHGRLGETVALSNNTAVASEAGAVLVFNR